MRAEEPQSSETRAKSSADARKRAVGRKRRKRRSRRPAAMAKISGDNGHPWRTPAVTPKPRKCRPPATMVHSLSV
eukprot:4125089-Lingulodinium_polyedra.AAC.1